MKDCTIDVGKRGGSVAEHRTLPCCVLEQDTLIPESTGNTQEAVAPSRHDRKIVDWDVKPQHKQTIDVATVLAYAKSIFSHDAAYFNFFLVEMFCNTGIILIHNPKV